MNRKIVIFILSLVCLVQSAATSQGIFPGTFSIKPESSVSLNESDLTFRQKFDVLCMALLIYRLDAVERLPKSALLERLDPIQADTFAKLTGVEFDLDKVDLGKKGWTRYYPFSLNGNDYFIRIFRSDERYYQPKVEVLMEGRVKNPSVTFQIIRGVNSILGDYGTGPGNLSQVTPGKSL